MISDAGQNGHLEQQQGTNVMNINAGHGLNSTQSATPERDKDASLQAIFADMDDVEQMVILLNMVLERQLDAATRLTEAIAFS
jgi:hypothetical protein